MEELQRKHDGCLSFAASETLEKAEVQNNLILKCRIEKAIRRIVKRVKLEEGQSLQAWCFMRVFPVHSRVRSACHVSPCLTSCRMYAATLCLLRTGN